MRHPGPREKRGGDGYQQNQRERSLPHPGFLPESSRTAGPSPGSIIGNGRQYLHKKERPGAGAPGRGRQAGWLLSAACADPSVRRDQRPHHVVLLVLEDVAVPDVLVPVLRRGTWG